LAQYVSSDQTKRGTALLPATQFWQAHSKRILVERAELGARDWLDSYRRLRNDLWDLREHLAHSGSEEYEGWLDPREPLIWSYCVLMSMPQAWLQDYRQLKESSVDATGLTDGLEQLRENEYSLPPPEALPAHRLKALATLVRTFDADLAQFYFERPQRSEPVPGYPCWVIPCPRDHRAQNGKPAERRALKEHAIIPVKVGAWEVELILHPRLVAYSQPHFPKSWLHGAAVFQDLKVMVQELGPDEFLISGVECDEQMEQMLAQHSEALAAGCNVLIWPELTVPHSLASRLRGYLTQNALAVREKIDLILPGSWHVRDGTGRMRNRAFVYGGRGEALTAYDKRMKYGFGERGAQRFEAIEPGSRIPVIAFEDRLVAIGVCLDFCYDCDNSAYRALDVDLVLVPSMGPQSTVEAHLRHARELQSKHETNVMVVQQVPVLVGREAAPGAPRAYSFVTPPPPAADSLPQTETWRALRGRR
jgi:hypothetical protein